MGNLDRLDFDISGDAFPQEKNVKIIDIYSTSSEKSKEENAIDKYVVFSSNLIKCFKSKLKDSSARLRVDSLIKAYKAAEDTYNKDDKHSLSLWCMANVNCFLDITEGKNFNIEPSSMVKDSDAGIVKVLVILYIQFLISVHSVHVPYLFELRVFLYLDAYRVFFSHDLLQVPV